MLLFFLRRVIGHMMLGIIWHHIARLSNLSLGITLVKAPIYAQMRNHVLLAPLPALYLASSKGVLGCVDSQYMILITGSSPPLSHIP